MQYKQIDIDSALNKITKKDSYFCGNYTVDPYRNCEFGCIYCDSATEKKVIIKNNIIEILDKELKKIKKANIIIGSVHDPYQKIEKTQRKTRNILKLIIKYNLDCHILTKSELVLRDIDLLKKIKKCIVTISMSTLDKKKKDIFEKNTSSPETRLKTIKKLNKNKIISGLALIPILPYITDHEIEEIIKKAKENNSKYFLYKYLELKGDQRDIFFKVITQNYPNLIDKYKKLYKDFFLPKKTYVKKIDFKIKKLLEKYNIKEKIC